MNQELSYMVGNDLTPRSNQKSEVFSSIKDDEINRSSIIQRQVVRRAGVPHPTSRTSNHNNDRQNNHSSLLSGRDSGTSSLNDLKDGFTPIKSQQHTLKAEFHLHKAALKKDQYISQYVDNDLDED